MKIEFTDRKKTPTGLPESRKKAYRSPVLSMFGDVRRLTAGGGGTAGDGKGKPATKA